MAERCATVWASARVTTSRSPSRRAELSSSSTAFMDLRTSPPQAVAMCSRTPSSQSTSAPRRSPMSRMPRSMAGSTSTASMGLNSNTVDRLSTALYT